MIKSIRKAAVLGSGVMGWDKSSHFANVGIPNLLLDLDVPYHLNDKEMAKGFTLENKNVRNRLSENALKNY